MTRKFRFRLSRAGETTPEPDPFPPIPEPALTEEERALAETEALRGVPALSATTPSPGERRVEGRFRQAMAAIQSAATAALTELGARLSESRHEANRLEADAARERERVRSLANVDAACQRLDNRYRRSRAAASELAGFRRARGIPDHVNPRPRSRGWIWLLLIVSLAETSANGILLHSASTEGVLANWLFAGLVTAMNVGLLGWLVGDLIARRMLGATPGRTWLLAGALAPCLLLAGLLHFGFAHYRDAVSALDSSQSAAILDLDDIDAGATEAEPQPTISVEEAVVGELRAQFLWWTPGAEFGGPPRMVPAGNVGYRAENGGLVRVEDALAGRFDGWRSVLLAGVGFAALLLAGWKWFGGREPIPHFARLHEAREAAARALEREYEAAVRTLEEAERGHLERLAEAERALVALGGACEKLDASRRETLAKEAERLLRIAEAGVVAVEDYREANRQRRLTSDPTPAFWESPWGPDVTARNPDEDARWRQHVGEHHSLVMATAERARQADAAHGPVVAEAFAQARERLGQAARIPGARRRPPTGKPPAPPPDFRLVPGGNPERRLEAAPRA